MAEMAVSGVAAHRAGGLQPFSTPLDTPCRTPLLLAYEVHLFVEWQVVEVDFEKTLFINHFLPFLVMDE
jgi:hypothetical protein